MSEELKNPLLCDPETGVCEIPEWKSAGTALPDQKQTKAVKITYFTDPICSSCWGIEPQLRKLKLEYGDYLEFDYRMGGLLPDWSYNSGGISKPSDVASHWEEVSAHYEMPIDGGVWLEDPLPSSYPPSIAVKAAQMQNPKKGVQYMRKLRELLFMDRKNITRWEVMLEAAVAVGLDTIRLKEDFDGKAKTLFEEDLAYARALGVRSFPTLFFKDADDNQTVLKGFKPYEAFEEALLRILPDAKKTKIALSTDLSLFNHYPTLTVKEYAVISDISTEEAGSKLDKMFLAGELNKQVLKTGVMYRTKTPLQGR